MNPSSHLELARLDPVMRRLIRAHGPLALQPKLRRSPFESLARAIAHQQLNGTAAETILGRFIKLCTRQAMMMASSSRLRCRSNCSNRFASMRHPLLSTRKKTSMRKRLR